MPKVLVIATSRQTRGGITSVVKAHEKGAQWEMFHCRWIEPHRDGNLFVKLWYLITAWIKFMLMLPSCDIVHIHLSEPPSALRKRLFFYPFVRLLKKKIIVHFHAFSPDTTIRSKQRNIYKYVFENADCIVVLSEYWRREVENCFDVSGKVRVIYNPCLENASNKSTEIAYYDDPMPKAHSILYAGTVNKRKGYADMIKAFAKIANQHNDWQIVFAGNGEIEQGKTLAEKLGISSQTLWLGWVNGTDKDKAFKEATVFCLPSYAEGFPMSVLDAWSYGLPVITTPVGGIPDVARDGDNMLLFKPGDVNGLAECMERMITDRELRDKISRASLEFARTTFNIETINRQIEKLYSEILQI